MDCWLYDDCNHKDCDKEHCFRKERLTYLYDCALLSSEQRKKIVMYLGDDGLDKDKFNQLADIKSDIKNFVRSGKNLYLYSYICGNGKTSWSIKLIQAYLNTVWPYATSCKALFISVPKLLQELKNNINTRSQYATYILENIATADLVVWDDIMHKGMTEFEYNQMLGFINARLDAKKSNIYTTNVAPTDAYKFADARLVSRVVNMSIKIELNGLDKRNLGC